MTIDVYVKFETECPTQHDALAMVQHYIGTLRLNGVTIIDGVPPSTWSSMGVGSGAGKLFVHGDIDSIHACREIIWEKERLARKVATLESKIAQAKHALNGRPE